ncbi:anthrax toxin lethal factor-related metalloendopeptidase, partial [Bacillus cereus]|uniref:anthrax toxin lethal factor-related metalloendopeptidase n=1 Tax=Bacillus cereus TaxID=1396 RepID=UPI000BF9E6E2
KLLSDAKSIEKMNQDIEKYRGNLASLPQDSKTNMDMMDKAFKLDSAKLGEDLDVHKNLKITDLGYHMDSFYKPGTTTIDIGKVITKLKTDFKYGMINNFMEVHLAEPNIDSKNPNPIQLDLEIPKGTRVAYTDKDKILIDRNYGIDVTETKKIVQDGQDVIKVSAKLVPKQNIEKKIKAMETTINTQFKKLTGSDNAIVKLDMDGFYASSILDRAQALIKQLANNIPNNLAINILGKMNKDGALVLTDKGLETLNSTWNDTYLGVYTGEERRLYVNINHKEHIERTGEDIKTIIHEFGHAIDHLMLDDIISKTPRFKELYQKEKDNITIDKYIKTNEDEFFAGVFEYLYSPNVQQREQIKKEAPEASNYIERLVRKVSS